MTSSPRSVPLSAPLYGIGDGTYKTIGEEAGVRQLVDHFYTIMAANKPYQPLFNMHSSELHITKDKLARFLMGWMGGERTYQSTYGAMNIPSAHAHLNVTQELMDNWLACMTEALHQQGHAEEFCTYLITQLAIPAQRILQVSQMSQP